MDSGVDMKSEMEKLRSDLDATKNIVQQLQKDRPDEHNLRNELNTFKQPLQQICSGMNIAMEGFQGIQKHLSGANVVEKSTSQPSSNVANGKRKLSDSLADESWKKLANFAKDSSNSNDQLRALQQAGRITEQFRNFNHFHANGFVSIFVESLRSENEETQYVAAKALSNIAQGTPEQVKSLIDSKAIPALIQLLDLSSSERVREKTLEAFANITYSERTARDQCVENGLIKLLSKLTYRQASLHCMQNFAKILANFTVGDHPLIASKFIKEVIPQIIPLLKALIHHYDPDVLYKTCIALFYISGYGYFDIIIENGFIQPIINALGHSNAKISKTVYFMLIEMVKFINGYRVQYMIDNGILEYMKEPLMESNEKIQEVTISLLSKLSAGTSSNVQAIIDAEYIPLLLQLLNHKNHEIRAEIIYILLNIVNGGSEEQIQHLLTYDIIPLLCKFDEADTYHEMVGALHTILIILTKTGCRLRETCLKMNAGGGIDRIRKLQSHDQEKVQYFCYQILSQFFPIPFVPFVKVEVIEIS
uniref:Armadillo repeat-containing domain-containing protein n=1 Tax=Panagrolaimus sp. ES5 TaxID=591445 RepID=A0AC34FD72_9BILA